MKKKYKKYMHAHGERPNPRGWVGVHISYICTYMYAHAESIVISKKNKNKPLQLLGQIIIHLLGNWNCMYVCMCVYLTNVHLHETCTIDHVICIYHCTNSYIHTCMYMYIHRFKYMYTDMCMTLLLSIGEINSHGTYVIIAQRLSYNFLNMHYN